MKGTDERQHDSSINIASILCWILGVLNIAGGISIGIPMIHTGRSVIFPFIIFALGAGLCISGKRLRNKTKNAGMVSIVFALFSFVSPPVIGLILGILIIVLIIINWKNLE